MNGSSERLEQIIGRIAALEQAASVDVSLREYFDAKMEASDRALQIASASMAERLAGMNEFRAALESQAAEFVNRKELDVQLCRITDIQDNFRSNFDKMEGKASAKSFYIALVLSLVSAIGTVAGLILSVAGLGIALITMFGN